jgi:beta-galactosidase
VTYARDGLWFGGDYNPEQWDDTVLAQDDELMRLARVNAATVGVFAWSSLEPRPGEYTFDWLDRSLDRLHRNGVRVVLATPTASPPPWFGFAHPDALPVGPDGVRLWHGSRDTYCAAAPAYRQAALEIAGRLAERYAGHPALAMWHVHNEYGSLCHCDHAAAAFRRWLQDRHGDLASLNAHWHTAFWSQGYDRWNEIVPPRRTQYLANPGQLLDFRRFWSDELLAAYREQADLLRRHTPDIPVTTNFMLPGDWQNLDLWRWSREVDVVAIDHYLAGPGETGLADLAYGADLARSLNRGRPWLLMEQATSVIYLYDSGVMVAKPPGRLRRDSIGYVARGSDASLFFQWRAGRGGSEFHHAAMVPHPGPDTRGFREITELGEDLAGLGEVAGSTLTAEVAVLWDVNCWWAVETPGLPSTRMRYTPAVREVHEALWRAGVLTDFAHPEDDLGRYRAVFAPNLYLLSEAAAGALERYVRGGGRLLVGCFSGVADDQHLIRTGGYPGGLRDVLGLRVTEFLPLLDGETVTLDDGTTGTRWSEDVELHGASALASYTGGPLDGRPALTRHDHGDGTGWYLSTRLEAKALAGLVGQVLRAAGVPVPELPPGVEVLRRSGDGVDWLFCFNHGDEPRELPLRGHDLLTGRTAEGSLTLPPGGVAVLRVSGSAAGRTAPAPRPGSPSR